MCSLKVTKNPKPYFLLFSFNCIILLYFEIYLWLTINILPKASLIKLSIVSVVPEFLHSFKFL